MVIFVKHRCFGFAVLMIIVALKQLMVRKERWKKRPRSGTTGQMIERKVVLNIDNEKLSFNAPIFWRNTLQTFVIGYVTMIGFALYLTDSNISMADFKHPLLWMPAMLIAPIIGTIRALK